MMDQAVGSPPPTWEIWFEFLDPDFGVAQSQLLEVLGE